MILGASSDAPRASVVIPTRNRVELLLQAIRSVRDQSLPVELLVMDDGSTDGTAARVRDEFPTVRLYREEIARGPAWQRNRGAELASASALITLDDDCQLVSPQTLSQALAELEPQRVGAVTIPFINIRQSNAVHSAAPGADRIYCTAMFFGGMVAFKRSAYEAVAGYRSWYFMHVEEPDLALRLLDAGYVVRLGSADPLHHHESPSRNSLRLHELGPRNHVLFAWQNVPMPQLLVHLPGTLARAVWYATKIGHPLLGLRGGLRGLGAALFHPGWRSPVSPAVYQLLRQFKRRGAVPLDEIESMLPSLPVEQSSMTNTPPIQTAH